MAKIPQQRGGNSPKKGIQRGHLENRHNSMVRGGKPWLGGGGGGKKPPGGCALVLLLAIALPALAYVAYWSV